MRSLDEARAYQKQEKSVDTYELWAAILATHDALVEMGGPGLPELHVNRARANLIRAGQVESGDYTDAELKIIAAADGTRIPRGESNLVYRSAKGLFEKVGKQIPPLKITQTNPIPMARGLGSSSACIIAGLLGANRMLGDVLNTQELLTLATSIEGHPDNVAPAVPRGPLRSAACSPARWRQSRAFRPRSA